MTDTPQISPVLEVSSALLTHGMDSNDVNSLKSDTKGYIASNLNIDIEDLSVSVVENNKAEINLVLPYYTGVEALAAKALAETDLDDVGGGEIIITLGVLAGMGIGAAIGTGSATLMVAGGVIGGVTAAVAGGAVAGAAAGAYVGTDKKRKKKGK